MKRLGLGLLTAGMVALAAPAHAVSVDYTGLAFNSLSSSFAFSKIGDEVGDLAFGGITMTQETLANGLGQAVYTINGGTAVDGAGGLIGATVDFGASTVPMLFGANSMSITGGQFQIKANNGTIIGTGTNSPTVTLPFGFGSVTPDYELENGFLEVTINGVAMTFQLCETAIADNLCGLSGDDRPFGSGQPYNTLSVNAGPDETDLAMFVYMRGTCADEDCPFYEPESYEQFSFQTWDWETVDSCNPGLFCRYDSENKDIYMKLALWGSADDGTTEVPEPATLSLFGLGLLGLGYAVRRRRSAV